jgi:DNA polymerase
MSYKKLHIDFETRSTVDLVKAGTYVYVSDPLTDVLCMGYRFDKEPVKLWVLGDPPPTEVFEAIEKGIEVCAHNAHFEFMIWNYVCSKKYNWPRLPIEQLDCTMIRAFSMGLPGKLETASKAVGLHCQKDMKGHRIMMQLCKPRAYNDYDDSPVWWEVEDSTPGMDIHAKYQALYEYCRQDVIVECALDDRLLPLSESEKRLWRLDQKINSRGVHCDIASIEKAIDIVEIEKTRLNNLMKEATNNKVPTCNASIALKNWINSFDIYGGEVYEEDGPLITYKEKGKTKRRKQWLKGDRKIVQGVGKKDVLDLLDMDIPKQVKEAILIRQEASKSSTAKLKKMIEGVNEDNRVRGCFQFYGAASTGRWAGRRIQLQNIPRPSIKQPEIEKICQYLPRNSVTDCIEYISTFYGSPTGRISDCVRAMIQAAPGKKLIACDFAAIEARVLAWLAGQEDILNVFRGHGKIYEHTACGIYNVGHIDDITQSQRQIGKVATLALGYQGGVKAFQSMAKNYFLKIEDSKADEIKVNWRRANPFIVGYWYNLERAAIAATERPNNIFEVGPKGRKVAFLRKGSFLFCRLPSGRAICYPYPKMKEIETPWGEKKRALTYKGEENYSFITKSAYGGLIAENIVQAVSRDILAHSMFLCEQKNYHTIMHVHDELVFEVDKNFGSPEEVENLFCVLPKWAEDLPISAEAWEGQRFRK